MNNKTRNIIILTCMLLLAGCSMPKDQWVMEMYKIPVGDKSILERPGMYRCMGENPADVSTEINDLWRKILMENEKSFAKVIDFTSEREYIARLQAILEERLNEIIHQRFKSPEFANKNKAACDKAYAANSSK